MQGNIHNNARRKPTFTIRKLYADTFRMFKHSAGTLIGTSCIGFLVPLVIVGLLVYACFSPLMGSVGATKYLSPWSSSTPWGYVPAWQWSAAICGVVLAFLYLFVQQIVIYPRMMGAMVYAAGNAHFGIRVSIGEAFKATGGGRFGQLIVVALCMIVAQMAISTIVSIASYIVIIPASIFMSLATVINEAWSLAFLIPFMVIMLLLCAAATIPAIFITLTYPVAICENKKHFHAVWGSVRYVSRAFWRVWAGFLPYVLFILLAVMPISVIMPIVIATMGANAILGVFAVWITFIVLIGIFSIPLYTAYSTAAYYNIREADGYGVTVGRDQGAR